MKSKLILSALCVISTATVAAQTSVSLKAPAAGDIRPTELVEPPAMALHNNRREAVSVSWVSPWAGSSAERVPFEAVSRSSVRRVPAKALVRGIELVTDAPGAVLRVSTSSGTLDAQKLMLTADGRRQPLTAMSDQIVDQDDLRAAGLDGAATVVGARLSEQLAGGVLRLSYEGEMAEGAVVVLSILDRNSDTQLAVQSASDHFARAERAYAQVDWLGSSADGVSWSGMAVSPDGREHALIFSDDGVARMADSSAPSGAAGLWEWRIEGVDARGVHRSARTAFALSPAVARLAERASVARTDGGVTVTVTVQANAAGRYEVRGVLVGASKAGQAVVGASAQWLEAGTSTLTLHFDAAHLKAAGLDGPLALRDLTLMDQSRMSLQERRGDALTF